MAVAAVAAEAGRHAEPVAAEAARIGVAAAAAGDHALLPADGSPLSTYWPNSTDDGGGLFAS